MFGKKSESILVIKTDGLAAFVAAEPVFDLIRSSWPNAKISLLTNPSLQRLARAAPYFDQVAAIPSFSEPEPRKAFIRQLKNARFARVFDLSADDAAKKLHASLGPFRPKWFAAGPAQKARGSKAPIAAMPDLTQFTSAVGLEPPQRLPNFSWALSARKDSANMQPAWFGISGQFGLLLPTLDETRRWPASAYARLARQMAQARIMPVMSGGKGLHAFGDEIAHEAPEIVDLSGKCDHLQLTALAQEAAFFVSDASEEVHLTASVGCSGVLIRKAAEEPEAALQGRNTVTLTTQRDLANIEADFVWRTLDNMGLIPDSAAARRVVAR